MHAQAIPMTMTRTLSTGSIFVAAIANVLAIAPDANGLLYLTDDGCLSLVAHADDAPENARFVSVLDKNSNTLRVAARLAHVARQ